MRTLEIDIECFSKLDLAKCGVYRYAEELELLLFGYSADGGEVRVVDIASGEKLPDEVRAALVDPEVEKWAHNASYERVCLSRYLGTRLKPDSWYCTMVWAATLGLPLSLKGVGAVIGIDKQKIDEGKELISYFCKPCNPTKANGGRTRNLPTDSPEKWERFKAYNKRDVEAEMEIKRRMSAFPVRREEWDDYHLSEEINDRGIGIDTALVEQAIKIHKETKAALTEKARALTLVENPDSVSQMKEWLATKGMEVVSLGKKDVEEMLKRAPPDVREVLELRLQLAKSSVKKYEAMRNAVCKDGRVRGMFMFYGAARTGRYCLAEGTPVLVKDEAGSVYEKPIEAVAVTDMVFDGERWVRHEGVVYSGDKDVISWDGITATKEHMVFIDADTKIPLLEAKERGLPIWRGRNTPYIRS